MKKYLQQIMTNNTYGYEFKTYHDEFTDTDFLYIVPSKKRNGNNTWMAGIEYKYNISDDYSELTIKGVATNEEFEGRGIISKYFANMLVEILNQKAPIQVDRITMLVKCNNIAMLKVATSHNFKPCGLITDADNKTNPEPYIRLELSRMNRYYQDEMTRGIIGNTFDSMNKGE